MREILFRGKTYDGKWEQGDLRHGGYVHNDSQTYIMRSDYALHNIPVDPKTVGQYTGLTDKNGKRIFEGDIIKADNWLHQNMKIYTIVFENSGFYAKHKDEDCWNFDHLENIEIIGNITDNPELLKDGE